MYQGTAGGRGERKIRNSSEFIPMNDSGIIIYNNKAFAHFHLFTDFLSSWEREDGGRSGGSGAVCAEGAQGDYVTFSYCSYKM